MTSSPVLLPVYSVTSSSAFNVSSMPPISAGSMQVLQQWSFPLYHSFLLMVKIIYLEQLLIQRSIRAGLSGGKKNVFKILEAPGGTCESLVSIVGQFIWAF